MARAGSANSFLLSLNVGDYSYIETTAEGYAAVMRTANAPRSRRPEALRGCEFTCALYRAIGARVDDIKVLVKVERIA